VECWEDPAYRFLRVDNLDSTWAGTDGSRARCDLADGGQRACALLSELQRLCDGAGIATALRAPQGAQ